MSNLRTNLESAAREAFRLYPEIYKVDQPTNENQLEELADAYGEHDGFWEAGLSVEECRDIVAIEWAQWVIDSKEF